MSPSALFISVDTLIAVAPMLGFSLEDRSRIREEQELDLVTRFMETSSRTLSNHSQRALFVVAPLDVLIVHAPSGGKRFHIIETNGTGIGGLTNLPLPLVTRILESIREAARTLVEPDALVLVASSGIESHKNPRRNHTIHEKILYVEALKTGFADGGKDAQVFCMNRLMEEPASIRNGKPSIVLGYIKEFLNHLEVNREGRLCLFNRPVTLALNDRFCLNIVTRLSGCFDLGRLATLNRSFATGADKGLAYGLLNEYAAQAQQPHCSAHIDYKHVHNRFQMIESVTDWLRQGKKCVIKPQGTGLGHGLEFFLDPDEPLSEIVGKVDHSIRVTEQYYGLVGGAFPYTVCEFADTCTVACPDHPLHGHKYEVRVVVYRDGITLRAVPSIAKISSQGYDADRPAKLSLINNISLSAEAKRREGTDFMLPLSNRETLDLLEIDPNVLAEVCSYCTGFIGHILDTLQAELRRFGLPERELNLGIVNGQRVGT